MCALINKLLQTSFLLLTLLILPSTLWHSPVFAQRPVQTSSWASLPLKVFNGPGYRQESDNGYPEDFYSKVAVTFGTPPQPVELNISFEGSLLSAWSSECIFCPRHPPFSLEQSSTLQSENESWEFNSFTANGTWFRDSIGFGELQAKDVQFVRMERLSLRHPGTRIVNGELGVWSNTTSPRKTLFNQLWDQGALLNPVIGLRTDQVNPKMTIGALDQNDYVGTINWIEIRGTCAHTSPGEAEGGHTGCEDWREDGFIIDGLKGYNGSFIPFDTSEITATLPTFAKDILVPPEFLARYFSDPGYHGPNMTSALTFNCYGSEPGPPFAITINGVDYPLKSYWFRLFRINPGLCRVGMSNHTDVGSSGNNSTVRPTADVELGLPFMRSVYIAYRFPTPDSPDCPPHIGFAFPSGLGYDDEIINQTPKSLPPLHDQCLSFLPPVGDPFSSLNVSEHIFEPGSGAYRIYGDSSGGRQVRLVGADEL